ncbi:MAG: glycosyltransferase [Xanthomonadaceae bacterium]|nr:glycosyltransferase [Xanthomonadaceae bacterium]
MKTPPGMRSHPSTPQTVDSADNRDKKPQALLLGGLHLAGPGYPNASQTISILKDENIANVLECGTWLPESMHLWRLRNAPWIKRISMISFLMFGNLFSLLKVLWKQGSAHTPVYVPYPAIFFLWWSSWIPARWRPRCIADAYISVWDSMYRDRNKGNPSHFLARTLKAFESRALRSAELILTDTVANKNMYTHEFGIDGNSISALPLAIRDDRFLACLPKSKSHDEPLTILFVGTLIPLHGIDVILAAIKLLMQDPRLHFHLLGDGQLGHLVEETSTDLNKDRFTWTREWASLDIIAEEICKADICLGIFGGKGKAARVLPFKAYMYLASGKAMVSQASFSLPEDTPPPPMLTIPTADPTVLANSIMQLTNDEGLRTRLASEARDYYIKHLGHKRLSAEWGALLLRLGSSATHN